MHNILTHTIISHIPKKGCNVNLQEFLKHIEKKYGSLVLDKKQAAKELSISINGLHNLRMDGKIRSFTIGNRVKYRADEIAKVIGIAK